MIENKNVFTRQKKTQSVQEPVPTAVGSAPVTLDLVERNVNVTARLLSLRILVISNCLTIFFNNWP